MAGRHEIVLKTISEFDGLAGVRVSRGSPRRSRMTISPRRAISAVGSAMLGMSPVLQELIRHGSIEMTMRFAGSNTGRTANVLDEVVKRATSGNTSPTALETTKPAAP